MSRVPEAIFPIRLTAQELERLSPDDLDEAAKGSVFIPWVKPPRVGTVVGLDLACGDDPVTRLQGLVVWSRPARPGVVAGFRAQLESPSPALLARVRETVRAALNLKAAREEAKKRHQVDGPIEERLRTWSELTPITGPIRIQTGAHARQRPEPTPRPTPSTMGSPFQPPPTTGGHTRQPAIPASTGPVARSIPAPLAPDPFARPAVLPSASAIGMRPMPAAEPPPPPPQWATPSPVLDDLPPLELELPPAAEEEATAPQSQREMEVIETALEQDLSIDEWNLLPPMDDELQAPSEEPNEEQDDGPRTLNLETGDRHDLSARPEDFEEEGESGHTQPRWAPVQDQELPEEPPPPEPEPLPTHMAVRITFSSTRTFLRHYERFFERGEVYVASDPVPSPGTLVRVTIGIPDGDAPVTAEGVVLRAVEPPEVPRAGWLARLVDMDGSIAERLATARVMLQQ